MEAFVTTGLVLKETRYNSDDPDTGTGRDLGSSAEQPAAEEQAVQRVRAVLLFRVHTGAGPQHVHCAGSGSEKCLSRHLVQH